MRQLAIIPFVLLAACGDDGGSNPPADSRVVDGRVVDASTIDARPDAPPPIDAPPTVVAVACPITTVPEITAPNIQNMFVPATETVGLNGIVKFTMPSNHSVVPHVTLPSDDGLRATFSTSTCLQFTTAGTFNFQCNPHGFTGTVTVTAN